MRPRNEIRRITVTSCLPGLMPTRTQYIISWGQSQTFWFRWVCHRVGMVVALAHLAITAQRLVSVHAPVLLTRSVACTRRSAAEILNEVKGR